MSEKHNFIGRYGHPSQLDLHIQDWNGSRAAAQNPAITDDQLEKLLTHRSNRTRLFALKNHSHRMSDVQMERALKVDDKSDLHTAVEHIRNPKHIDMVINNAVDSWEKGGFNMGRRGTIHTAVRRAVQIGAPVEEHLKKIDTLGDQNLSNTARMEITQERQRNGLPR